MVKFEPSKHGKREATNMFIDTVVFAGVGTVLLMLAFFGGIGYFIWNDSKKRKNG